MAVGCGVNGGNIAYTQQIKVLSFINILQIFCIKVYVFLQFLFFIKIKNRAISVFPLQLNIVYISTREGSVCVHKEEIFVGRKLNVVGGMEDKNLSRFWRFYRKAVFFRQTKQTDVDILRL